MFPRLTTCGSPSEDLRGMRRRLMQHGGGFAAATVLAPTLWSSAHYQESSAVAGRSRESCSRAPHNHLLPQRRDDLSIRLRLRITTLSSLRVMPQHRTTAVLSSLDTRHHDESNLRSCALSTKTRRARISGLSTGESCRSRPRDMLLYKGCAQPSHIMRHRLRLRRARLHQPARVKSFLLSIRAKLSPLSFARRGSIST